MTVSWNSWVTGYRGRRHEKDDGLQKLLRETAIFRLTGREREKREGDVCEFVKYYYYSQRWEVSWTQLLMIWGCVSLSYTHMFGIQFAFKKYLFIYIIHAWRLELAMGYYDLSSLTIPIFFFFENNYSLVSIGSLPSNFRRVIFSYIYI